MELKGNTILITGGSSGIGLESAHRLSEENRVLICGRSRERLETAKLAFSNVDFFQCDLFDEGACRALAAWVEDKYPECNVLINNAAVHHVGDFLSGDDSLGQARMEVNINLMAPIILANRLIPTLLRNSRPTLVNVTTGLIYAPKVAYPFYNATKAALHSFTQVLRSQMSRTDLHVVEVMFPAVDTLWHGGNSPSFAISVDRAVSEMLRGLKKGKPEIHVGKSGLLRLISRISPNFAFKKINSMR